MSQSKNASVCHKKCKYCGGYHERNRNKCQAFGQTRGKCKKKNNFPHMCRASKNALHYVDNNESSSNESSSEECFRVTNNKGKQWFSKVNMSHLG